MSNERQANPDETADDGVGFIVPFDGQLPEGARRSLQDAYRETYGEELSDGQADILGMELVETMLLARRMVARGKRRA